MPLLLELTKFLTVDIRGQTWQCYTSKWERLQCPEETPEDYWRSSCCNFPYKVLLLQFLICGFPWWSLPNARQTFIFLQPNISTDFRLHLGQAAVSAAKVICARTSPMCLSIIAHYMNVIYLLPVWALRSFHYIYKKGWIKWIF